MGQDSAIQWTDNTFNPWIGCTKVSPGCLNCYAEARDIRYAKGAHWGKGAPRQRTSETNWKQPLKWNKQPLWRCPDDGTTVAHPERLGMPYACPTCGISVQPSRARVFCASLSDWLDDEVPIEWLADLLKLIHDTPNLDWLLLTKRPQNWLTRLDAAFGHLFGEGGGNATDFQNWLYHWRYIGGVPHNIWIGTTVEDQERANERIPELLKIPARIRFLSCEPLLERIDLTKWLATGQIHWVIWGGESSTARLCNIEWIRTGVEQCRAAGVAPFVKQLGAHPFTESVYTPSDAMVPECVTQPLNLDDRKGGDINEWPQDLRVREFPTTHE